MPEKVRYVNFENIAVPVLNYHDHFKKAIPPNFD
jgi:hypothetical protein